MALAAKNPDIVRLQALIAALEQLLEVHEQTVLAKSAELEEAVQVQAEQARQLAIANADLLRSNEDLEKFAYAASHDLQEPLRAVIGFTQLLHKRYLTKLDEEGQEFVRHIVDGTTRMRDLIHDLLAYSRVSRQEIPFASVDCGEVVREALRNVAAAVEERGARVTWGELPTVMGHRTLLVLLLQNLLSNAVKYCDAVPQVRIEAVRRGGEWLMAVRDNGIGIDAAHHEKIFVIFQRLHTREAYSGTGVGLAICKRIVERHGGRMWVESEPGRGSTFYFTLLAAERTSS